MNNIDLLFIVPPYRLIPPYKYKLIDPPRSIIVLATMLNNIGFKTAILDMPMLELGYDDLLDHLIKLKPKIIGIQNRSTYSFPIVEKTARCIKSSFPDIPIIVGGTHVTYNPTESLISCKEIDIVLIGETEYSLPRLLEALLDKKDISKIEGLAYRDNEGKIVLTSSFIPVTDLSEIPNPDLSLIPVNMYINRAERYILDTGRGCKYNCPYCTSEFIKGKINYRPSDLIIGEILNAYSLGFRNFYFFDNMFTANKELVLTICKNIIDSKITISWPCMTNIGMVDDEILKIMHDAGCDLIAFGIETITKSALSKIGKQNQIDKIRKTFELTRLSGIRPLAFVMHGLPNTTFVDELETIKFIANIKPDAVRAFCFKPFPGTSFYNDAIKHNIKIINNDLSRWSILDEPTHETTDLSKEEIIEARVLSEYLFRSGGTISAGVKYRRRKGVQIIKTGEGGLLYNPYVEPEIRKTDMYLNAIKLNPFYFEVLFRCDGYHNIKDIKSILNRLFDISLEDASAIIQEVINESLERKLIIEIPDVMNGRDTPITNEEAGLYVGVFNN